MNHNVRKSFPPNSISDQKLDRFVNNKTIQYLHLDNNSIGSVGASILTKNSTITDLSLSNNNIDDDGAKNLAANKKLEYLNLSKNSIKDPGATAFASLSRDATNLLTLDVSFNHISPSGVDVLKNNKAGFNVITIGNEEVEKFQQKEKNKEHNPLFFAYLLRDMCMKPKNSDICKLSEIQILVKKYHLEKF